MNSRHHQNFNLKEFGNSTHFLYVSIIIIVLGHFSAVFSGGLSPWAGCPLFLFMKTAVFELKHEWDTWYVANLWADCDRFTWFLLRIHWVLEISRNKTFFFVLVVWKALGIKPNILYRRVSSVKRDWCRIFVFQRDADNCLGYARNVWPIEICFKSNGYIPISL